MNPDIEAARLEGYQRGLKDGDKCTAKSMEIAREAGFIEGVKEGFAHALKEQGETVLLKISIDYLRGWNEAVKKAAEICNSNCSWTSEKQIRDLKPEGGKGC